jgi:hypothetical protein
MKLTFAVLTLGTLALGGGCLGEHQNAGGDSAVRGRMSRSIGMP